MVPLVTSLVCRDLGQPEFRTCFGNDEESAIVAVPETTVNEHNRAMSREDKVRLARQGAIIQAVAESCGM